VRAGEVATRAALPEIRKWLETEPHRQKTTTRATTRPAAVPAD
jgi:hypothetical protein